jgi:hypothetical protein
MSARPVYATSKNLIDSNPEHTMRLAFIGAVSLCSVYLIALYVLGFTGIFAVQYDRAAAAASTTTKSAVVASTTPVSLYPALDKVAYDAKLLAVANNPAPKVSSSTSSTTSTVTTASSAKKTLWPTKAPYPTNGAALLPFHRIIAYYGNFYSTHMGVLGEYPAPQMLQRLNAEVAKWNAADPKTPAIPAIDYIAVTAQGSPGADGMYRFRMPDSQIDQAVALANQDHGIVILDIQVGLSTVQKEIPLLKKYLAMPNVHLALDPEFSMKDGAKPGSEIGTLDASDINWTSNYLAQIVKDNNLPPKVLVVHRFTQNMVTHTSLITPLPEVQIVMDMDGWGSPAKKLNTYQQFVATQPVQFTGFKLFYKNDLKAPSTRMLTPAELIKLTPQPLFIQFQ